MTSTRQKIATLQIGQKNAYGRTLYYPDCWISKRLIKLTGRPTFTLYDIQILESLGFEMAYIDLAPTLSKEQRAENGRKGAQIRAINRKSITSLNSADFAARSENFLKSLAVKKSKNKTDIEDLV